MKQTRTILNSIHVFQVYSGVFVFGELKKRLTLPLYVHC